MQQQQQQKEKHDGHHHYHSLIWRRINQQAAAAGCGTIVVAHHDRTQHVPAVAGSSSPISSYAAAQRVRHEHVVRAVSGLAFRLHGMHINQLCAALGSRPLAACKLDSGVPLLLTCRRPGWRSPFNGTLARVSGRSRSSSAAPEWWHCCCHAACSMWWQQQQHWRQGETRGSCSLPHLDERLSQAHAAVSSAPVLSHPPPLQKRHCCCCCG